MDLTFQVPFPGCVSCPWMHFLLNSPVTHMLPNSRMTAAYSRIMDVDMAEEMTSYTTYQILAQAGTSMLAQANERPSQVLQLLQ